MAVSMLILEAKLHRLAGQPAQARPAADPVAVAFRATVQPEIQRQAPRASQQRHAAAAHVKHGLPGTLRYLEAEQESAVFSHGDAGMREGLVPKPDLQGIRMRSGGQFAVELERRPKSDPSGNSQVRNPQRLGSLSGEQTLGREAALLQGQTEVPPRIIRTQQPQVCADGEGGDVGIPHIDLLEQAQRGVVLTVFEREQSAVNRREYFDGVRERAPGPIDQAYRRRDGFMLQCKINFPEAASERAIRTAP